MQQDLIERQIFGTRTVTADTPLTPSRARPDTRALFTEAERSPAVTAAERASAVRVKVESVTGSGPTGWPNANDGRPVFAPVLERSTDGKVWETIARFEFHGPGEEVRSVAVRSGDRLRFVEALGGLNSSASYSAALVL
jgi:hypothetical protein